jgi:protein SCO1/2
MRAGFTLQRALALVLVSLLGAIAVVLIVGRRSGSSANRAGSSAGPAQASQVDWTLPPGLRAPDFSLTDQGGRRVTLSAYRGRVVVLTFIHSLCHDACPFMVEQIKGALGGLGDLGRSVPAIGVSVAPAEDTRANRRRFLARHQMTGRMAFVSGPVRVLRGVWRHYAIQPVQGPVDHSTFVLLIDKRGIERVGIPADQLTPEGLAHDIGVLDRERA